MTRTRTMILAAPQHYFAAPAAPAARLRAARAARRAWPTPLNAALRLARSDSNFVVTAATPGVKADHIQLALIGSRHLRLQILQPHPVAPAEADSHPDAKTSDKGADDATAPAPDAAEAGDDHGDAPDSRTEEASATAEENATAAVDVASSAPYYATDSAPRSLLEEQAGEAAAGTEMVVILEKMLTLPQPVDDAGITCSYSDGLLRIEIPIVAPADTEREQELVKLQEDISEAAAQLATLEQQVREQREKVQAAHSALRKARAAAPCNSRRAQPLTISTAEVDASEETKEEQ